MNEATWLFRLANCRDGIFSALPNQPDNLARAALVPGEAKITMMCFDNDGT